MSSSTELWRVMRLERNLHDNICARTCVRSPVSESPHLHTAEACKALRLDRYHDGHSETHGELSQPPHTTHARTTTTTHRTCTQRAVVGDTLTAQGSRGGDTTHRAW